MIQANKKFLGVVTATLMSSAAMWEGTRYYAYYDIAGVPTVCQGYTGSGIVFGRKYTPEECSKFLKEELVEHSTGILKCVTRPLEQHTHDAFTLFAYNVGVQGACSSRAIRLYNAGNVKEACTALYKGPSGQPVWSFARVNGEMTFVKGLYNRRKYEAAMCLGEPNAKLD